MALDPLVIAVKANTRQAERAFDQTAARAADMSRRIGQSVAIAATAVAGFAVVKGAEFLKGAIHNASDLNETLSKTGVLFGKGAGPMVEWSKTAATTMGLTQQAALDAASSFAMFGSSAGLTGDKLNAFAKNNTALAADMGSFFNTTTEDAATAISAAFRGENEPIRRFNIMLDEGTLAAKALELGLVKAVGDKSKILSASIAVKAAQKTYAETVAKSGKNSNAAKIANDRLTLALDNLKAATKGTVPQLTAQQKVLAAQAAILDQTKAAQGDFARTSGGLANQTKTLTSQFTILKTNIGTALLPVVTALAVTLTTVVMPALANLWAVHGPKVVAIMQRWAAEIAGLDWAGAFKRAGDAIGRLSDTLSKVDIGDVVANLGNLVPTLQDISREAGPGLADTMSVTSTVVGFLADNIDLLAKALPYLAAAFLVVKTAQSGANIAAAVSPGFKLLDYIATKRNAAAYRGLTAAMIEQTAVLRASNATQVASATAGNLDAAATNRGVIARGRAVVSLAAHKVATVANTIATKASAIAAAAMAAVVNSTVVARVRQVAATIASTVAMVASTVATYATAAAVWVLNVALLVLTSPIALVIIAIVALVAIFVIAYKKSDTFRRIVDTSVRAVADAFIWMYNGAKAVFGKWASTLAASWQKVVDFRRNVLDTLYSIPGRLRDIGLAIMRGLVDGIQAGLQWVREKVQGLGKLIPGWLKSVLGIRSPSKVMAKLGRSVVDGLADGMAAQVPVLRRMVAGVGDTITGMTAEPSVGIVGAASGVPLAGAGVGVGAAGTTYHITVNVAPGADPAEAGRLAVKAIEAHERRTGRRRLAPA